MVAGFPGRSISIECTIAVSRPEYLPSLLLSGIGGIKTAMGLLCFSRLVVVTLDAKGFLINNLL
jgi:hypothetical protein